MIIVHIVKPFAAGIAVFVRSLTNTLPDASHIVVHNGRKNEMTTTEVKSKFPGQNSHVLNGILHNALAIIMPKIASRIINNT